MSLKEEVFGMTLAQLDLHHATRFQLIRRMNGYRDVARDRPLPSVTVGEVVAGMGRYKHNYKPSFYEREFIKAVAKTGLTRLDWVCLPRGTVSQEAVQALSMEELLATPATALPLGMYSLNLFLTILYQNPNVPDEEAEERFAEMPLEELLKFDSDFRDSSHTLLLEFRRHYRGSVMSMREQLRAFGIQDEEWRFMTFGTREEELDRLTRSRDISEAEANLVLNVARSERWIPDFLFCLK